MNPNQQKDKDEKPNQNHDQQEQTSQNLSPNRRSGGSGSRPRYELNCFSDIDYALAPQQPTLGRPFRFAKPRFPFPVPLDDDDYVIQSICCPGIMRGGPEFEDTFTPEWERTGYFVRSRCGPNGLNGRTTTVQRIRFGAHNLTHRYDDMFIRPCYGFRVSQPEGHESGEEQREVGGPPNRPNDGESQQPEDLQQRKLHHLKTLSPESMPSSSEQCPRDPDFSRTLFNLKEEDPEDEENESQETIPEASAGEPQPKAKPSQED